ncbi:MAG TPA: GNAT family N-acetyltransferase [Jatrophihabitans sp.]|nr:GNAT family N-acetyltransferase [Jatrophihabitans sp.]
MSAMIDRLEPGQWAVLREMRLASLADSPTAFWATHADEAAFDHARWDGFVRAAAWFVATQSGQRVGMAGALTRPEESDEPELIGMWVAPQARRSGVGAQLVDAVCEWATAQDARAVSLWVLDGNDDARRVYVRSGFTETGERMPLPRDPTHVEIRMRKSLRAAGPTAER